MIITFGNRPSLRSHEIVLYKTRVETKAFQITIEEANELFKPLVQFEYSGGYLEQSLVQKIDQFGKVYYELYENNELKGKME